MTATFFFPTLLQSNSTLTKKCFAVNGCYVGNMDSFATILHEVLTEIDDSEIFENKRYGRNVFNESADSSLSNGRMMVDLAEIPKRSVRPQIQRYCNLRDNVALIGRNLIEKINNNLNQSIMPGNSLPTILLTTGKDTAPQLLHSDMPYDVNNEDYCGQFIVLLALQNNTHLRISRGSHAFNSYDELLARSHFATQIVTLRAYDFIVMHPKLIHGGWVTEERNLRIHFYVGMMPDTVDKSDDRIQNSTELLPLHISPLFTGERHIQQATTVRKCSLQAEIEHKKKKVQNFYGSNKSIVVTAIVATDQHNI